ncbi:MAG TPA: hypothetical protein VIY48_02325, partial [Candidatus Paceibacterota bacterium]
MSTGVVVKKAEVWRRRGNNWRKEGKPLKTGEHVTGNVNGDYFYLDPDRRTKKQWIKIDTVIVTPPVEPPVDPPQSKTWYFVKFQWLRADASEYHDRDNLPMVFRMGEAKDTENGHYTKLDEAW